MKAVWCINPVTLCVEYENGLHYVYDTLEFYHEMPDWMPLGLHIALEKTLHFFIPLWVFSGTPLEIVYHFVYGLICDKDIRSIMRFCSES